MVKEQLIKIAGNDVTAERQTTWIEDTISDQTDKAEIIFTVNLPDTYDATTFDTIEIWEDYDGGTLELDENRVFKGIISKIVKEPTRIVVTAYGDLWRAVQTEVNKTYDRNIDASAGKGSEIFKNLCDLANLSYDSSTIVDTGSTLLIDKFVCNKAEVFERMQTLAEIYGYQIWYSPQEDKVHFEPTGYTTNPNTITVGGTSGNTQTLVNWMEDGTKLFNKVEIIGAYQEVQQTESFDGTGSQDTFTLEFEPEITDVFVDSVQQIGGVAGSTATFDYQVDKDQQEIVFESGSIPASGSDNVVVTYSYRAPRPVVLSDPTSIANVGYEIKQRFTYNDIQSIDDAENRARELLTVYATPFLSTTCKLTPEATESFTVKAGERIRVVDDRYSYDTTMLIKRVVSRYPESDVELEVGDKTIRTSDLERDTTIRLKRLEEELAKSGTFIVEVIDLSNTVHVENRYVAVQKRTLTGDGLIFGNLNYGIYGTNTFGEDSSTWELHSLTQGNDVYTETFYDQDFLDTISDGATWDTVNNELNM